MRTGISTTITPGDRLAATAVEFDQARHAEAGAFIISYARTLAWETLATTVVSLFMLLEIATMMRF